MPIVQLLSEGLIEGVARAAQLAPLAFVLNAPAPAAAQLPRPVPALAASSAVAANAATLLDPVLVSTPLRLVSTHLDVRIRNGAALIHSVLVYRNDDAAPVQAHYTLPQPARLTAHRTDRGPVAVVSDVLATDELCSEEPAEAIDAVYDNEQFIEAGEQRPAHSHSGSVTVGPSEEITVEIEQPGTVLARNDRYRMVLPLLTDRHSVYTPQFSADVLVEASHPIRSFASATHGGDVQGIGERLAVLSIPEGRVFEGKHFAIEFEIDRKGLSNKTAAWDGLNWGGETRGIRVTALNTRAAR